MFGKEIGEVVEKPKKVKGGEQMLVNESVSLPPPGKNDKGHVKESSASSPAEPPPLNELPDDPFVLPDGTKMHLPKSNEKD